ncbi:hypothetical protein DFAR_320017 [Desulfarculales bacterium]
MGHGLILAYFDEAPTVVWLRCFLCPDCWAVIQLRPRGYWSRFQAPVETIWQSFSNKLARGRWDPVYRAPASATGSRACCGR